MRTSEKEDKWMTDPVMDLFVEGVAEISTTVFSSLMCSCAHVSVCVK